MRIFPRYGAPAERRCKDAETIEHAVSSLTALAVFGHSEVPISRVLILLGREPAEQKKQPVPGPDPEADPMTGCLPVTAAGAPVDPVLAPRPPSV